METLNNNKNNNFKIAMLGKTAGRCTRLAMYYFEYLVFFGDGDCPACGGDLIETTTGEVRKIEAATHWQPADVEFCKVDICNVCSFETNKRFE